MPTSPKLLRAADPANVSLLALGRYLGALKDREHALDRLTFELGSEPPQAPLDRKRLRQRQASHAQAAIGDHVIAVEKAILTGRAMSLADAVAQVMLACAEVNRIGASARGEALEEELDRLELALESALRVMAPEAGVKLADIGGRHYAGVWCERWPEVDTSGLGPEEGRGAEAAIDERVGA